MTSPALPFRTTIGTTNRAREFSFASEVEARAAANDLWRWAKDHGERGTVSVYEWAGGRWRLVQTAKV